MTQALINLVDYDLGRSKSGVVHGPIYLLVDDLSFPDSRWTDFVVVILGWWCRALSRIVDGDGGPIEVRFMEGPYLVELGPLDSGLLHLALVEAGTKRRYLRQAEVEIVPLIRSILSAADQLLAQCKARGWWSTDEDNLETARSDLGQKMPGIALC